MTDTQTTYGIISIKEYLENATLVKYVYDQITLSEWQVNSLSASYHLSVGLKGTSIDIYDDVSDNLTYTFFVNGSSYFQGNCKINNDCKINNNLDVLGSLNVTGVTIFDKDVTVKNLNITNDLNVSNDSYFNNNVSVTGIVDISSNLFVKDDALFYSKLNVSGNVSLYSNLYVNNNVLVNSNVSINGSTDISNALMVNGPVSFNSSLNVVDKSFFRNNVIIDTNLSSPTLYTSDKATIHNLSIVDNASINTLYVGNNSTFNNNINALNNTSLNTLYVTNNASFNDGFYIKQTAVINNMSVQNNTILNSLNVTGNTTLSTTNVTGLLNVSHLHVSNDTTLNTLNISGAVLAAQRVECRDKLYVGPVGQTNTLYPTSAFDVKETAFIGTLYANQIRCDDMTANTSTKVLLSENLTSLSVYNTTEYGGSTVIYASYIFGQVNSAVKSTNYTYGTFSHGLSIFDPAYTLTSTFDLSANAATLKGITYNGPVNIGILTPNTFNLNASGIINYDGSMNIGQIDLTTTFNLNGNGIINYDGSMNIGQTNLTTQFNLNGNGIINYDGSMNIGQNTLSEFNLNASGIMKYDGIINIGSNTDTYLDISANSMNGGINYNGPVNINSTDLNLYGTGMISYNGIIDMNGPIYIEHDGDTTLDVIGNTKMHGNLLLGGNITSYSDIRIKDNIHNLSSCLSKIDHISGYSFTRKDLIDKDKIYIGLIAQEVEEYFPDLVTETEDIKSINYQSMVAVLLECIKELKKEINELKIK
jgi:hypothetical protein